MTASVPLTSLVVVGVGAPLVLLAVLGGASLVNRPLSERWTASLAAGSMTVACAALSLALVVYGTTGTGTQLLSYGAWSASHEGGIAIEFLVDRLSLAFAALSAAIVAVVSAFSNRYLHRESGYNRYFVLLAMFVTGMLLVALAGNVQVLFIGWEFVGLSSALLVAFFTSGPQPCRTPCACSPSIASAMPPCSRQRSCCATSRAATACRCCLAALQLRPSG